MTSPTLPVPDIHVTSHSQRRVQSSRLAAARAKRCSVLGPSPQRGKVVRLCSGFQSSGSAQRDHCCQRSL
jgi:hypothetical protein